MGKDLEKFERLDCIKDRAISLVESQINGDVQNVDAKELGEIADIAKDMAEAKKLCYEAEYYKTVVEAMNDADTETNKYYMNKYIPEIEYYGGQFRNKPIMYYDGRGNFARRRDSRGRFMYNPMPILDYGIDELNPEMIDYGIGRMYYDDWNKGQMPMYQDGYYKNRGNGGVNREAERMHDPREGRAGKRRKMYMEAQEIGDQEAKKHELEEFFHDLGDDMVEMFDNATPQEKQNAKQKLTALIGKL